MKPTLSVFVILLAALAMPGCIGTLATRDGDIVGRYPGAAIGEDFYFIGKMGPGDAGAHGGSFSNGMNGIVGIFAIISLPLDFALDTILLPVDCITWPFGLHRKKKEREWIEY